MQQIDNKSLDLLFNNQAQESRKSFANVNRSVMSQLHNAGERIANKMKPDSRITDVKSEPTIRNSFERTIKERETDTDNKSKTKAKTKEDEELVLINHTTTQILRDVETELGIEINAVTNIKEAGASTGTAEANIEVEIQSPDFDFIGPPAPISAEIPVEAYQEDISDLNLSLLPFTNLEAEVQISEATETQAIPIPLELRVEVLTEMTETLTEEIEDLTKLIANIDLSTELGVEKILELSNQIEELAEIRDALSTQVGKLTAVLERQGISSDTSIKLNSEAKTLVESRLEKFITAFKELKASTETNKPQAAQIQQETETRSQINQSLGFKDRIELLDFRTVNQEVLDLVKEAKASANESANLLGGIKTGTNLSDSGSGTNSDSGSNTQQNIFEGLQQVSGSSQAMTARAEAIGKPVQIERLLNLVAEKATQVPNGVKQELKLMLNPENMGEVGLSITKEGNKLDIKLMFSNEDALKRVEHKLVELKVLLKSRGFESKIELSQTNTENSANTSSQQNANTSNGSYNEAREEQKERLLDRPNWLDQDTSSDEPSFDMTYEGITN